MSGTKELREDFLDEDNEIPGQRYALLSFLSPEKILASKDQFFFTLFLKQYEINWKTKNLEKFLAKQVLDFNAKLDAEANRLAEKDLGDAADICRSSRVPIDTVLESYQNFVKENQRDISQTTIKEAFDDFIFAHEKKLEDEFFSKNNFQTTVRGLKIRGSYSTQEEAAARAKKLQRNDPIHNIYVAEVGKWLAWDPSPSNVQNQEYQEDQLNQLMKSYKENEEQREQFFNQNPELKNGGKGKGRSEKEIMNIVGPTEEVGTAASAATLDAPEVSSSGSGAAGEHASLFNGPADLALERKLERLRVAEAEANGNAEL
jgi:hypothetical protein